MLRGGLDGVGRSSHPNRGKRKVGIMSSRARSRGTGTERGAALVEFALVVPLLLILIFGIVETGFIFSQQLEVRHGAREGARLAAVNYGADAAIAAEVCDRMNFTGDESTTTVTITKTGSSIGDTAEVSVSATYSSLTGFLDGFFGSTTLSSTVDIRLEQVPQGGLGSGTAQSCP